jgi:hypothetical protein
MINIIILCILYFANNEILYRPSYNTIEQSLYQYVNPESHIDYNRTYNNNNI